MKGGDVKAFCAGKVRYDSWADAKTAFTSPIKGRVSWRRRRKKLFKQRIYRCELCDGYHLTNDKRGFE